MTKYHHHRLTRYPEGSVKELFSISFPIMLSFLSGTLMLFVDRLILANFSLQAMNAATLAGVIFIVLQMGFMALTSIAEVFAAQYNGAKEYTKVGRPVWQMIWFSFATAFFFWFLALTSTPLLLSDYHYEEFGRPYFNWLLIFGFTFPMQAAVASFFIGIGRTKLLLVVAFLGNILNVLLDLLLVFGWEPYISSMGTMGAALATGLSQAFQVSILLWVFLNLKNRQRYHTDNARIDWGLFKKCFKIGAPNAIGLMIELTAWAMVNRMMSWVSEDHLTVISIGKTFFILVAFTIHGLQKGVTAVVANLIGSKNLARIHQSLISGVKILLGAALLFTPLLLVYPDLLINEFLNEAGDNYEKLFSSLKTISGLVWLYFIFDGLTWLSAGVLTAAGDTLFVMLMNAFTAWIFALLPIYIIVVQLQSSPETCWLLLNFYAVMNALFFYLRYKGGVWKKKAHLINAN